RGAVSRMASIVLTIAALAASTVVSFVEFDTTRFGEFAGQVNSDELANVGRIVVSLCAIVATIFAVRGRADDGRHGEFQALLLASVCGMGLFVAASSFVTLFVGLELFSIALYVLCALDADRASSLEAGLKYLIVGGMSSAVLLYGSALVYGATGSLDYADIGGYAGRGLLLHAGAAMVLGGLAFKISAAPMHWWTPDVYEGAGTPVTAFMATATKVAAFIALARVLTDAFGPDAHRWVPIVAALSVTSIVVGNFGALVQSHLKRMLAYSSIAQAGYLLLGIVAWDETGLSALVYALIVYATMSLGAFAYIMVLERDLGRDATFADLAGRGWITADQSLLRTLPALGMVVCSLSLAGIPPTAGFFSKFGLFQGAVEADYAWLAVVAALGSVVSLGYYLRVGVELYMRAPDASRLAEETAHLPAASVSDDVRPAGTRMPVTAALGFALAVATLVLAFLPTHVFDAGCKARGVLVAGGGACTRADANDDRAGDSASTDASPGAPVVASGR
ncbi:MAG: proton-translocating NADH-quinone oxidoreductase, chain, partial [Thermoleophilia bacterium]|nr:proton-translocating NADH-quinone oxidoreductase, chain [Thermoleophilia bacterium]